MKSVIVADGRHYGNKISCIQKGAGITLLLFVPRKSAVTELSLFLHKDGEKEEKRVELSWEGLEGDCDLFSCDFPQELPIGLYWYRFEAESGYETLHSTLEGGRVSFSKDPARNNPLQLTVYERKYQEPAFLEGGLFYHVFVDRFYRGKDARIPALEQKEKPDEIQEPGAGKEGTKGTNSISETEIELSTVEEEMSLSAAEEMTLLCKSDPVKSRYHLRKKDEWFDNYKERSLVLRDDWGGEPVWQPDLHQEILNNDFFGGNLAGIREKIPYFKELGVTCLYLSPIFEAYSSHKYDTGDYNKIDTLFGDEKEFSLLCKEAKKAGIAVMLDGVFNHTGADSIYFNKYGSYDSNGAWNSAESSYRKWFQFGENNSYLSWWGIETLPTLAKNCPEEQAYLFGENGIIRKWIRLGASGWRLDVVDELPGDFLKELVKAAKSAKEDAVVLGEVWEDASNKIAYGVRREYFQGEELDSVMNYPWKDAVISYLRDRNARGLADRVDQICHNYPKEVLSCLMNPLGTHDSMRILTALGAQSLEEMSRERKSRSFLGEGEYVKAYRLLKMASLMQMMLPGVPCIYYGDEAGMEGYNDPFNRRCYPWGREDQQLLSWYHALTAIRKKHRRFFAQTDCRVLTSEEGLFGFMRKGLDRARGSKGEKEHILLTYVNRDKRDRYVQIYEENYLSYGGKEWKSLLLGQTEEEIYLGEIERVDEGLLEIRIPADYGYVLLWK